MLSSKPLVSNFGTRHYYGVKQLWHGILVFKNIEINEQLKDFMIDS